MIGLCESCVYYGVCDIDEAELDCCIPEGPLREKQKMAWKVNGVEGFAHVTHKYIKEMKSKSTYWSTRLEK